MSLTAAGVLQVPVAFWAVEASQPAWAEVHGEVLEPDHSLEELMQVEAVPDGGVTVCCGLGCVG